MKQSSIGKGNSLLYALFVAAFLVWQSISISYDKEGLQVQSKEVPLPTIVACSAFIAIGLGVNILDTLQTLTTLVNRNAVLISSLAKKVNVDPEEIAQEMADSKNEDKGDKNNGG
jgi:hypothetical protein